MTKIPRLVREQAALICAIAASNPQWTIVDAHWSIVVDNARWKEHEQAVLDLALDAKDFVMSKLIAEYWLRAAEAEALLRTGWEPTH